MNFEEINMRADIYKVKYKYVFGPITLEHIDFIEGNIYCSDGGTYELNAEQFVELKQKFGSKEEFRKLLTVLNREIKKGQGHFSFRVFV